MDITVHQSDQRRSPGHLSRQGPPALRWALFEAAQVARRPGSPDRDYYEQAAERLGGNRACLAVARKLLKRSYHTLRRARRGGARARMSFPVRAQPFVTPMRRGRLPACSRRHARVVGPKRPSGRNASPSGITPSTHHVAGPGANPRVADRSKAGRPRAHEPHHQPRTRVTSQPAVQPRQPRTLRLTRGPCTSKEQAPVAVDLVRAMDEEQKAAGGAYLTRARAPNQVPRSRHAHDLLGWMRRRRALARGARSALRSPLAHGCAKACHGSMAARRLGSRPVAWCRTRSDGIAWARFRMMDRSGCVLGGR